MATLSFRRLLPGTYSVFAKKPPSKRALSKHHAPHQAALRCARGLEPQQPDDGEVAEEPRSPRLRRALGNSARYRWGTRRAKFSKFHGFFFLKTQTRCLEEKQEKGKKKLGKKAKLENILRGGPHGHPGAIGPSQKSKENLLHKVGIREEHGRAYHKTATIENTCHYYHNTYSKNGCILLDVGNMLNIE